MASTTGMMAPAFFVGRNELISWVNDLLGLRLTKVEQCASGAVYCQIMDAAHRTTEVVPMRRVNFEARRASMSTWRIIRFCKWCSRG